MVTLTPNCEEWQLRGHVEEYNGHHIYTYFQEDNGSKSDNPMLIFLHGYPTSSYDWVDVVLNFPSYPILAFDFLGFGLSDKPREHNYTLIEHADLTVELIKRYLAERQNKKIFIIAHDMATSVTAEILARELDGTLPVGIEIVGTLLFNGNMVMDKASLVLGQKLLRSPLGFIFAALNIKPIFKWQFSTAVSSKPLKESEIDDQWSLLCYNNGHKLLHKTIGYTFERVEKAERLHGAITNTSTSVSFLWGMDDPVATAALQLEAWKTLRPSAPLYPLEGLGHYPLVEDPKAFCKVLKEVLQKTMFNK